MKYQHFSLDPLLPLWTHCTKRFVCAVKSFLSFYPSLSRKVPNHQTLRVCIQIASFVATTVLLSVHTIRGEHGLITKRFVCAVKSFRWLFASNFKPLQKKTVNVSDWDLRTPNMHGRKVWWPWLGGRQPASQTQSELARASQSHPEAVRASRSQPEQSKLTDPDFIGNYKNSLIWDSFP